MSKRIVVLMSSLALAAMSVGHSAEQKETSSKEKRVTPKTTTWKIQNAMSAAPPAIAKNATIVDHTGKEGGEMAVLRKGSNDWTCLPDDPSTPSNDPMCLDKNAMDWAKAWKTHAEPSDALWCEARPYGLFNRSQFGRSLDHVERHPL